MSDTTTLAKSILADLGVRAEEQNARLRKALEDAETFIERTLKDWDEMELRENFHMDVDQGEIALAKARAALGKLA